MAHQNEDLIRKGYTAFDKGDLDTLRDLFSPDIVWHSAGRSSLSGDRKGIDEVLALLGELAQRTGGTFKVEIHDLFAGDDHGVVLSTATAQRDGKNYNGNGVEVFHLKDGKITEAWILSFDQQEFDDFSD